MQILYIRPRIIKRLLYAAIALILLLLAGGKLWVSAMAMTPGSSGWTAPRSTNVKRVGDLSTAQNQSNFLGNLDCTAISYRLTGSKTMRNGCFTPTAFGMFDDDAQVVIYNGTDEGVRLDPFMPDEILEPWPNALNMVVFSSVSTGGEYIGLYKNVPPLRQSRNDLGEVTREQITTPPDMFINDPAGQHLVVNPQTAAFSADGSWLVVEDYNNSFVRINLSTLATTPFAPAFNNPIVQTSQVAISSDGRFVAIRNAINDSFKIYDLNTCNGIESNLAPQLCASYDYLPGVRQQLVGLKAIQHIRFINDTLLSFEATAASSAVAGTYELSPTGDYGSLTNYLGLGDSYTSGEGAFDYRAGTDTDDNKCHLSVNSYPLLLTRDLFGGAGGHSVACSGAVINDVGSIGGDYHGQVRGGASYNELAGSDKLTDILADFAPGYISQRNFVRQYQPRIVSVSIGGNDIGFGDILQNCVEPHLSLKPSAQTCYNNYESREEILQLIDRTVPKWVNLYKRLLADDPASHIYAIGYPSIAYTEGKCGLNVHLGKSELKFADELISYLDNDIQQAAQTAGVNYVDISHALNGHRLCEAANYDVAVNGLTAGNDIGFAGINVLGHESYHPNALGQQLIEQTILKQTGNLSASRTDTSAAPDNQTLLDAPKSGATVYDLLPYDKLTNTTIRAGSRAQLKIDGSDAGLEPNSSYSVRIGGSDGKIVTTIDSDDQGDIDTYFTAPTDTATGGTTIDVTGINKAGEPVNVTQPVYITASPSDFDGDGIANLGDSCPYAINSGQDTDGDGVDDNCDSLIGAPIAHSGSTDEGVDNNGGASSGTPRDSTGEIPGTSVSAFTLQAASQVTPFIKSSRGPIPATSSVTAPRSSAKLYGGTVLGATRSQSAMANHLNSDNTASDVKLKAAIHRRTLWYVIGSLLVSGGLITLARRLRTARKRSSS